MELSLHDEIKSLKHDIVNEERKVNQAIIHGNTDAVKKSLAQIDSDIKYLSIIANGAPINHKEDLEIRKFLIKHYQNKRNLTIFSTL